MLLTLFLLAWVRLACTAEEEQMDLNLMASVKKKESKVEFRWECTVLKKKKRKGKEVLNLIVVDGDFAGFFLLMIWTFACFPLKDPLMMKRNLFRRIDVVDIYINQLHYIYIEHSKMVHFSNIHFWLFCMILVLRIRFSIARMTLQEKKEVFARVQYWREKIFLIGVTYYCRVHMLMKKKIKKGLIQETASV